MSDLTKVANGTVNELRMKKQRAIEALDFELAEEIETEIHLEIDRNNSRQVSDVLDDLNKEINTIMDRYLNEIERMAENARLSTQHLYSKYQVIVDEAEKSHIGNLMRLEQDRAFLLIQESEREIEEQMKLLEQAKHEAILSHFDKAKELRQKAREEGEAELERRRIKVENDFEALKEEAVNSQKETLANIMSMHEQEILEDKNLHDQIWNETKQKVENELRQVGQRGEVRINAIRAKSEITEDGLRRAKLATQEAIEMVHKQVRVLPEFSISEKMRLTTISPAKSALKETSSRIAPGVTGSNLSFTSRSQFSSRSTNRSAMSTGLLSRRPASKMNYH